MKKRSVLHWSMVMVLTTSMLVLTGVQTLGFWPGYHYDASYSIRDEYILDKPPTPGVIVIPARYSRSAVTLLAFFSIEVDLSDHCEWIKRCAIRWPGHRNPWCCSDGASRPFVHNVCAESFKYWAENVLPFHSPSGRPAYGLVERVPDPKTGVEEESVCELWWGANGSPEARKAMQHYVLHGAVHPPVGEHSWMTLQHFGHILHGIQDFYSHSNWVRAFYYNPHIKFSFSEIPSWTSFWKSQRGSYDFKEGRYGRNLIVLEKALEQAKGDKVLAETYHNKFMEYLQKEAKVCCHKIFYDGIPPSCYGFKAKVMSIVKEFLEGVDYSQEDVDLVTRSVQLAWEESMQWAHQLKLNILKNPKLGTQVWNSLNHLELTDDLSKYVSAISRFKFILYITEFIGEACWY